jgi:hypothetical protein
MSEMDEQLLTRQCFELQPEEFSCVVTESFGLVCPNLSGLSLADAKEARVAVTRISALWKKAAASAFTHESDGLARDLPFHEKNARRKTCLDTIERIRNRRSHAVNRKIHELKVKNL